LSAQFLCAFWVTFQIDRRLAFSHWLSADSANIFPPTLKTKVSSSKGKCSVTPFGQAIFVIASRFIFYNLTMLFFSIILWYASEVNPNFLYKNEHLQ
jgi:hypothetical protein